MKRAKFDTKSGKSVKNDTNNDTTLTKNEPVAVAPDYTISLSSIQTFLSTLLSSIILYLSTSMKYSLYTNIPRGNKFRNQIVILG
jgi:hypothetical protein